MSELDEIKRTIYENGIYIRTGTQMNVDILEDIYEDVEDEINLVIQQAERAEKLEDLCKLGVEAVDILEKRNQRYKQAVSAASEELYYVLNSSKSNDVKKHYVTNAKRYLDEALKETND